jgi:hypothetical protein
MAASVAAAARRQRIDRNRHRVSKTYDRSQASRLVRDSARAIVATLFAPPLIDLRSGILRSLVSPAQEFLIRIDR